jgi:hypothetical protein
MSDPDDGVDKMNDLVKKLNRCNNNIKLILEMMKNIDEKLGSGKSEPVEKKPVGRPAGTYESKRQQYFDMLTSGKISMPKPTTLQYYRIIKDDFEDTYKLI